MMSAIELASAVKSTLKFEMTSEEIQTMHEFFRAKFRRSEVKRMEFEALINKKTVRKYDSANARSALTSIRA
jgi:hypothetical protein